MPIRIQRQRTKGWRMPAGAIYVGRPTKWGNNFRAGECGGAEFAVVAYRVALKTKPDLLRAAQSELRGKNLACWCPLDQPCHADVLLELANR